MIIFDLDGTLANIEHRLHFIDKALPRKEQNFEWFERQCYYDKPVPQVVDIFRCFRAVRPSLKFLEIWTGRHNTVKWLTVEWLQDHVFGSDFTWREPDDPMYVRLRMRPAGDNTPDATLKAQWLDETIADGGLVEMVFDDRQRVVDMWRRHGIFCLQVAKGDY